MHVTHICGTCILPFCCHIVGIDDIYRLSLDYLSKVVFFSLSYQQLSLINTDPLDRYAVELSLIDSTTRSTSPLVVLQLSSKIQSFSYYFISE